MTKISYTAKMRKEDAKFHKEKKFRKREKNMNFRI